MYKLLFKKKYKLQKYIGPITIQQKKTQDKKKIFLYLTILKVSLILYLLGEVLCIITYFHV